MKIWFRGLCAAALASALLAAPAAADRSATIRVEGATSTLVPKTSVTVPDSGQIPDADPDCQWNEPAGALQRGTGGDWDRAAFVQTIKGETQSGSRGWFYFMNGKYGGGFCFEEMPPGADIVVYASTYDASFNPTELPPSLRDVPSSVQRGEPFTVTVIEPVPDKHPTDGYYLSGTGTDRPAQGVTVTAGSATAVTGADGKATLIVPESGQVTVQARRGTTAARSEQVPLTVLEPGQAPPPGPGPQPEAPCATNGSDGLCGTRDLQAPITLVTSIRTGRTFRRGRGPRVLRGTAGVRASSGAALQPDPSGIRRVKLRLTRNAAGRCSAYSSRRERFVKRRCGARHGWYFTVGTRSDWRYLLPARLPRGRYVLDVKATDGAFNVDRTRRRGENRVVFRVR